MNKVNWIASRTYYLQPKEKSDLKLVEICVAISMPRQLEQGEYYIDSTMAKYGCIVQFGKIESQRIVVGRDSLEALFHGILAIENYLILKNKEEKIINISGQVFDKNIEGFLFGVFAQQYNINS